MADDEHHFCAALMEEGPPHPDQERQKAHKAAVLKANMWTPGELITIRFLEGDPGLQAKVRAVAERWVAPGMANLKFVFQNAGDTDIRIAFKQGAGSWSYIGTGCRQIAEPQPTMNYGWLTPASGQAEIDRVVLHEFGHALGLIHEHQNPKQAVKWNRAAVIADLSGPPNNWNAATIENNMFRRYDKKAVIASPTDPKSIMMYPIPKSWTTDGFTAGMNSVLSPTDVDIIRQAYQ